MRRYLRPRARYALTKGSLAHAGRAPEAEDRGAHVSFQFQDGQVFDDAVLDRFQAEVVVVQHLLCMMEVQVVLGHFSPGEVQHELDVAQLDAVVRGSGVEFLQARHLLVKDGTNLRRPFLLIGLLSEALEFAGLVHAQLFLDGAQLIVKEILPLLLVDIGLHLAVDFLLDLQQLFLGVQHLQQGQAPLPDVAVAQQGGAFLEIVHFHRGGDEIHQEVEVVYALQNAGGLLRGEGRGVEDGSGPLFQGIGQDLEFALGSVRGEGLILEMHLCLQVGLAGDNGLDPCPLAALEDGGDGTVGHF